MISIRVPKEIEKRLEKLASQTGRTKSFYIREALLSCLDSMEKFYLSVDRMNRPKRTYKKELVEKARGQED